MIRSKDEWKNFWAEHATEHKKIRPLPKVEWDKEFVVCVTIGERKSGLYSVEIIDVESDPVTKKLIVSYQEIQPPRESFRLEIDARPYHFVAVPDTDFEIVFDQKSPRVRSLFW